MYLPTPPLTPLTLGSTSTTKSSLLSDSPEMLSLPPPLAQIPELDLDNDRSVKIDPGIWRPGMTMEEKVERRKYLAGSRGRKGLRIVIVTENFLPKIDGVTRTLSRLLQHLQKENHQCMLLGPGGWEGDDYAGHPLVGTLGIPLVVYPGLKLNFLRPKFLSVIKQFEPDVIHFVDPIWLGAQTLMAMELGWAGEDWVTQAGPALGAGLNGAIVASYHTNLATYATLFGMPWLEPIMWRFQRWLYSKTLVTLCPSASTRSVLQSNGFSDIRLWPRGVDLSQFSPLKRSVEMRASWGVATTPVVGPVVVTHAVPKQDLLRIEVEQHMGVHYKGRKSSLPMTPPDTPAVSAEDGDEIAETLVLGESTGAAPASGLPDRVVILYVGRISWEKNIHLLLEAYSHLLEMLPEGLPPKLVFVGDGPARVELQERCAKNGWDAVFMGQRTGEELCQIYASGDVFGFASFTETFGQVVLEALASGLPVIGLDAEGTRDLVTDRSTGLLLPLPDGHATWPSALHNHDTPTYDQAARDYAKLLAQVCKDKASRLDMGRRGIESTRGMSWWEAMEKCVDGYRESINVNLSQREQGSEKVENRVSRVSRVVSRGLRDKSDTAENIWHLKNLLKLLVAVVLMAAIYQHHRSGKIKSLVE